MVDKRSGQSLHQVVIVGGGFGGLYAAKALRRAPVEVTLIDKRNFNLFQPLLYQVATGALSPADIASPIRAVLGGNKNAKVLLSEVEDIEPNQQKLMLRGEEELSYDTLIVATGVSHHYFGNDQWQMAPVLTTGKAAGLVNGCNSRWRADKGGIGRSDRRASIQDASR